MQYYRARSTNATGNSFTITLLLPEGASCSIVDLGIQAQQDARHDPLTSKLEHQLLGLGAPTIPARARLFHTMEQARSYIDGWNGIIHNTRSLLDFSEEGYLDRDKYEDAGYDGDRHGN